MNETIASIVQALTVAESDQEVKFEQETSITDVKNILADELCNVGSQGQSCGELRSAGGSSNVSKESPMSASTQNAVIEESVRKTQGTVRTIVAYIEEVHGTTLDPGSARPHVIRSEPSVPDVKTACVRRKRKSCRKALVKLNELVMLTTIDKTQASTLCPYDHVGSCGQV